MTLIATSAKPTTEATGILGPDPQLKQAKEDPRAMPARAQKNEFKGRYSQEDADHPGRGFRVKPIKKPPKPPKV